MRTGILTLHSQLNYGGVLQAWAMQRYLQSQGGEVVVLDRWPPRSLDIFPLARGGAKAADWVRQVLRIPFGVYALAETRRAFRTKRFLNEQLNLSKFHFTSWQNAPADLGVDKLVVGSDQVWNAYNCRDGFFLLEGAPALPAVAQAASFGMREIPPAMTERYRAGLARFSSIRVREREGVELVRRLGFAAEHVDDPTLCVPRERWNELVSSGKAGRQLTCYFISEDIVRHWDSLVEFSRTTGWRVKVFVNACPLALPTSGARLKKWLRWHLRRRSRNVKLMMSAGPQEFVQGVSEATAVISDSFHALMFSSIFGVPVWNVRPSSAQRADMFARIEEFQPRYPKAHLATDVEEALGEICKR